MVHWPEVMVSYDTTDKILFSADGFGKFGANDVEDPEGWDCEARRYYIGIVGKYGPQTQALLKKAAGLEIKTICPLHGPVLSTPEEIASFSSHAGMSTRFKSCPSPIGVYKRGSIKYSMPCTHSQLS